MAFTIRDIVNDALREINVCEPGDSPDDEDSDDGLRRLNLMISAWPMDGLTLILPDLDVDGNVVDYVHADLELTSEWPLDDGHREGVTAMLACTLAKRYEATIDPDTKTIARRGWGRLVEMYYVKPTVKMPNPLRRTGYPRKGVSYRSADS